MNMQTSPQAEFIEPQNELIKKTGTGGLSPHVLEAAQNKADSLTLNIEPFVQEKLEAMKQKVYDDTFLANSNAASIDDFLSDLVAFNVHIKLLKKNGLTRISSSLLTFIERLSSINMDGYHVIKAHVNALDIINKKSIDDSNKDILNALISELNDACDRYNAKYNNDF